MYGDPGKASLLMAGTAKVQKHYNDSSLEKQLPNILPAKQVYFPSQCIQGLHCLTFMQNSCPLAGQDQLGVCLCTRETGIHRGLPTVRYKISCGWISNQNLKQHILIPDWGRETEEPSAGL